MAFVAASAQTMASPAALQQSFLGSPLKVKPVVSLASPSRNVTCAAVAARPSAQSSGYAKLLENKSIGDLRLMAREKGLRGDTKKELIQLLLVANGAAPAAPSRGRSMSPAPVGRSSTPLSGSGDAQIEKLLALSMIDLRSMAAAKGIRGDTKGEIVKELLGLASVPKSGSRSRSNSPAPRAISPSSSSSPRSSSGGVSEARRKALDSKTMGELRAMARERGLRGDTKKELINLLCQ